MKVLLIMYVSLQLSSLSGTSSFFPTYPPPPTPFLPTFVSPAGGFLYIGAPKMAARSALHEPPKIILSQQNYISIQSLGYIGLTPDHWWIHSKIVVLVQFISGFHFLLPNPIIGFTAVENQFWFPSYRCKSAAVFATHCHDSWLTQEQGNRITGGE